MASLITIMFQGAQFIGTTAITVQNGTFLLQSSPALFLNGTLPFSSLNITNTSFGFANLQGGQANGTVSIPLNRGASGYPSIVVSNFSGTATIQWPAAQGPQTQRVAPGDPIPLNGFSG